MVPTAAKDTLYDYSRASGTASARREWQVYLQAGAGIVADSVRRYAYQQAGSSNAVVAATMRGCSDAATAGGACPIPWPEHVAQAPVLSIPCYGACRAAEIVCALSGKHMSCPQVPESEYDETVNKAAALGRAIDLAEQAFLDDDAR